jgi:hypothetical protein
MKVKDIKKLHSGDEVTWNDPDEGKCSRTLTIGSIKVTGDIVRILDIEGDYLECLAEELS